MNDERLKQLMVQVGMPDSKSLYMALNQVANEVGQEYSLENEALKCRLKRAYCDEVGADSIVGLDSCDDYKDWVKPLSTAKNEHYEESEVIQ